MTAICVFDATTQSIRQILAGLTMGHGDRDGCRTLFNALVAAQQAQFPVQVQRTADKINAEGQKWGVTADPNDRYRAWFDLTMEVIRYPYNWYGTDRRYERLIAELTFPL